MNPDQGFVDLRLNRQEGQTDDGFWPSFTDIMTVVVMIFMLAMVVLLLRNMELLDQLRATMQAEREAAELARTTGRQKETLAGQLSTAQQQIGRLREQVRRLESQGEQQEAAIASQQHQIARLDRERNRLQRQHTEQAALAAQLQSRLDSTRQGLDDLQARHDRTLAEQARTRAELERLAGDHQAATASLERLRQERNRQDQALGSLRDEATRLRDALAQKDTALEQTRHELVARTQGQQKLQALHDTTLAQLQDARRSGTEQAAQLARTREALSALEQAHRKLTTRAGEDASALEQANSRLTRLTADHEALQSRYSQAKTSAEQLGERSRELDKTRATLERLDQAHGELLQRSIRAEQENQALRARLAVQEQALAQALARLQEANLSLSDLQQDYGNLKLEYDDLVKPARTAEGRFQVQVRVTRSSGGGLALSLRESHETEFRQVTRQALDTRLEQLKAGHKEGLYVRVIIPEDSGLGYNEAWRFTSEILSRYDYYYQERPAEAVHAPDAGE